MRDRDMRIGNKNERDIEIDLGRVMRMMRT
jgi:hypothetical protein